MPLDCVLSDLDGTLIDTNDIRLNSFIATFKSIGVSGITRREIIPYIDESPQAVLKRFGVNSIDIFWDNYKRNIPFKLKLFDTSLRTRIEMLKNSSIKFGIVTSLRKDIAQILLETAHIGGLLDILVAYIRPHKPAPHPILKAINQLGVRTNKTIYIGDRDVDILAGRSAKVITGAALWSNGKDEFQYCQPDYWFYTFDEIVMFAIDGKKT